ncbi:MAG: SPASM domain-containing protein [Acidimicrobiia bacterium]|nr:SPASM domain-containing protein [Acidimicrobiia bacterium]
MRPLRGRQGTFDKIVENVRLVSPLVPITIGGNFDVETADSYPALLDFLREQEFAERISKINFKPVIKATPETPKGVIPLTLVSGEAKPLNGTCMTSAGAGASKGSSICDTCHFVDEKMSFLRDETRKRGFPTPDGVHMGPCEIHRKHAYTLGPDGDLYACPGFTGDPTESIGRIDGRETALHRAAAQRFDRLTAGKDECRDCGFMPVCGGGCSVAAHTELGDMHQPSCHKGAFESALVSLAYRTAAAAN